MRLPVVLATCAVVLATSDICSENGPVLHDRESMLATGVLTSRNIGWPKGPFPLPDFPCAVARDSMERQRGHIPLALSERNPSSGKQNGAFWQQRLLEARWIQGESSSFKGLLTIVDGFFRLPELSYAVDSVAAEACHLAHEAAQAPLAARHADATSVIVRAPPLQMGEQLWGLLRCGPGTKGQRSYSMADGQIHPLNESHVQSPREA